LDTREFVANRIVPMKKDHGKAFTVMDARSESSIGFPEMMEIPFFTMIPAVTISRGMKTAHRNPITDCLYRIRISRHASIINRWRYWINSRTMVFMIPPPFDPCSARGFPEGE
jgi:hypothetical protein